MRWKTHELEAAGPQLLRAVEQPGAEAAALPLRDDVDRVEVRALERGVRDHAAAPLGHPRLGARQDPVAHQARHDVDGRRGREIRHLSARTAEHLGDRRGVVRLGGPDRHGAYCTTVPRRPDEPVRLTRIYTGGGDRGETSLGDGSRVSKLDPRIEAFGTVDEVNAHIGAALAASGLPNAIRAVLERVQNELFDVGADLSVPFAEGDGRLRVADTQVRALEADCDRFNAELPQLRSFVLPGGGDAAARLHVARTVCRRAERRTLEAARDLELDPAALVYLNRLSDLLFILARAAAAGREVLWKPGASR